MSEQQSKSLVKSAAAVTVVLSVSKIVGFLRDVVLTQYFGTSSSADAYTQAFRVINIISSTISACVLATFIPMYTRIKNNDGDEAAHRYTNNVLSAISLLSLVLILLCYLMMPTLIGLFSPGFSPDKRALTVQLARIMLPLILTMAVMTFFQSYLNAHQRFFAAQLTGMPLSICVIGVVIVLQSTAGIFASGYGTLLGGFLQVVVLLPFLRGIFRYQPIFQPRDKHLLRTLMLMLPSLASVAINEVNSAVDAIMGSGLGEGAVASLSYSYKLINLVVGVVVVAVNAVIYTRLSNQNASGDSAGFRSTIRTGLMTQTALLAPIMVVAIIMGREIITVVYQRGAFTAESTAMTTFAFVYYVPSILFTALRDIMNRSFYSLGDTKIPALLGIVSVAANVIMNLALIKVMNVGLLALTFSLSLLVSAILLFYMLRKRLGPLGGRRLLKEGILILFCVAAQAAVMLGIGVAAADMHPFIRLCIGAVGGLGAYGIMAFALNMQSAKFALALFRRHAKKNRRKKIGGGLQ